VNLRQAASRIGGQLPEGPMTAGKVGNVIEGLREDVERWKSELTDLKAGGDDDLVERVAGWINEAEKVLAKWDAPRRN
jgi:hypothetical protein